MSDRYRRLVELIHEQAGENFRAAFRYDADEWRALYVRPELATDRLESVVPALAGRARSEEPLIRERDYPGLGPERASVSLHEEAVLVHFHELEQCGVVVTLDIDVARNLTEFVTGCERVLAD